MVLFAVGAIRPDESRLLFGGSGIHYDFVEKIYSFYILASRKNGTLYTGITSDLIKRVFQHREEMIPGFTQKYAVHRLVYFETSNDVQSVIAREKQVKKWNRAWRVRLIEKMNPEWKDLYPQMTGSPTCLAGRRAKDFGDDKK